MLNSSGGIIRYKHDDLDGLSDDEIGEELSPQGVTHVKPLKAMDRKYN
jgi:hypothetical protein